MGKVVLAITVGVLMISGCGNVNVRNSEETATIINIMESETSKEMGTTADVDLTTLYRKQVKGFSNEYYIDDNGVLWGLGYNDYGQLGNGKQDSGSEEPVKIAENVIHVDYSEYGFMAYLTSDGNLYGVGNAYSGIFPDVYTFCDEGGMNVGKYIGVTSPHFIASDVSYASCGQNDIAYIDNDGELWNLGVLWYLDKDNYFYHSEPVKVLDNVTYVSGNWYNYVALDRDGSVYTWGSNFYGNCGISGTSVVSTPTKVIDDCIMVWTGSDDLSKLGLNKEYSKANTFVQKKDGTLWVCGADAGEDERQLPYRNDKEVKLKWSDEFVMILGEK